MAKKLGPAKIVETGTSGDDTLTGSSGADQMYGLAGNDTYRVDDPGDEVIEAVGEGNDRVASFVSYVLTAGSEVERLDANDLTGTGAMDLTGNEFANTIMGNYGANTLDGAGANDVLYGFDGIDTLIGGGGADTLVGGAGDDAMSGGLGDDIYYVEDSGDTVTEAAGAAEGVDRVAASVSYALAAGASVETIEAVNQAATDAIDLTGSDIANVIRGNQGANVLRGAGGADSIEAFAGDDVLVGGAGNDFMFGGAGNDTYYVDDSGDTVTEANGDGNDRIAASASFSLNQNQHVEIIEAVNLADTTAIDLSGSSFANTIIGNAGANFLFGGGGVDTLLGLGGDDILDGGSQNDSMFGGTGNDTYRVHSTSNIIVEAAGEGSADRVVASTGFTLPAGAEIEFFEVTGGTDLTGNAFSQTITGNNGDNVINGGGGEDVMIGLSGSDRYFVDSAGDVVQEAVGHFGTDRISTTISYTLAAGVEVERLEPLTIASTDSINLTGNEVRNTITGNNGINTLDGGGAHDVMAGLGGADTFAFTTTLASNNIDTIVDFASGSDRIALDDAVFAGLAPGALPAGAFVIGTAALDADDRILYDSATGRLYFDADGNGGGAAVQFAILHNHPALAASDFLVI